MPPTGRSLRWGNRSHAPAHWPLGRREGRWCKVGSGLAGESMVVVPRKKMGIPLNGRCGSTSVCRVEKGDYSTRITKGMSRWDRCLVRVIGNTD